MDANVALLIVVCGFAFIYLEVLRPGVILPGVAGAAMTMTGVGAFSRLHVTPPGLAFIIVSFLLLLAGPATSREIGILVMAIMSMTSGLILLVPPPRGIAPLAAAAASGLLCPALELLLVSTWKARRNKRAV
jgi:membrane-bound ClpP family serine protease